MVEIFLLRPLDDSSRSWAAMTRPGRRAKTGRRIRFDEDVRGEVAEIAADGTRTVRFDTPLDPDRLARLGRTPLPPYIRRDPGAPDRAEDREAYQTVFARDPLAVAAPTAGLHFTEAILGRIRARGIEIADLTLAVGPGTFKPVTGRRHRGPRPRPRGRVASGLHASGRRGARRRRAGASSPWARPSPDRSKPRRSAATTRSLEIAGSRPVSSSLPASSFRVLDGLLTNFHLPRSTLLMLVSAFAGRDRVLAAYAEAVREGYLFYSFGDAMLVAHRAGPLR